MMTAHPKSGPLDEGSLPHSNLASFGGLKPRETEDVQFSPITVYYESAGRRMCDFPGQNGDAQIKVPGVNQADAAMGWYAASSL